MASAVEASAAEAEVAVRPFNSPASAVLILRRAAGGAGEDWLAVTRGRVNEEQKKQKKKKADNILF